MPVMEPITAFLLKVRRYGRAAFLDAHATPFLVLVPAQQEDENPWGNFETETYRIRPEIQGQWTPEECEAASRAQGLQVIEITKSADSPWRGRVSLGRARNSDLVVSAPSISKLHAHFITDDQGATSVVDAGSRNGTWVNGDKLEPGSGVVLNPGDQLRFGQVAVVFHSPASMCDLIDGFFEAQVEGAS